MVQDPIPPEIQQFIITSIDSVAHLEALLLLRNNPRDSWSLDMVAQRLYISNGDTAPLLEALHANGLIIALDGETTSYKYEPGSEELDRMVALLSDVYATHLVPVTNLIHSKSRTRIQQFADAFKLKKRDT